MALTQPFGSSPGSSQDGFAPLIPAPAAHGAAARARRPVVLPARTQPDRFAIKSPAINGPAINGTAIAGKLRSALLPLPQSPPSPRSATG